MEANLALGLPVDSRDYRAAAAMLQALGVRQVQLLSNNPRKLAALDAAGLEVVERVAHVSAPGVSEPGVFRRGHAQALVTGKCVFSFDPTRGRFPLDSLPPGEPVESVRAATGVSFDVADGRGAPPAPGLCTTPAR